MIFPFFSGILSFVRAPVTWLLFTLNLVIFAVTATSVDEAQSKLEKIISDPLYSQTQGYVFAQYVKANKKRYPASIQYLAETALLPGEGQKKMLIGGMSLRDDSFLNQASTLNVQGDPVLLSWWRKKIDEIHNIREEHPSYSLGVTQTDNNIVQWLAYQFSHSGMSHFVGNMIFLLLFGCQLELAIGGAGLLLSYLISGVFAALSFLYFNEASAIPLIGASGAVSGIMAMLSVIFWNRGVRYIFFLLIPKRGYTGFVFLPAWLTLLLWALSDLSGYFSAPTELGGIAYSAHLGGEICGILLGLVFLLLCKFTGKEINEKNTGIDVKPIFTTIT